MKTKAYPRSMISLAATAAALASSLAQAGTKPYLFPGVTQTFLSADGAPVGQVYATSEVRLHERKFTVMALLPPVDLFACELGNAIGAEVGGMLGGGGKPINCWTNWKEDLGILPHNELGAAWDAVSDDSGAVKLPPQGVYMQKIVRHFVPALEVAARGIGTRFEYHSAHTASTELNCRVVLKASLCDSVIPGKDAIRKASEQGITCRLPLSAKQIQDLRDAGAERCRAEVSEFEARYNMSWLDYVSGSTWIETQEN